MISAATHIARLARAGFVFAREGVFGVVDPSLVPPPGQLALKLARLIERPTAKSGRRLSRALTRLGPTYVKLGQFLATRPDVVGIAFATAVFPVLSNAAAVGDRSRFVRVVATNVITISLVTSTCCSPLVPIGMFIDRAYAAAMPASTPRS